MTVTEDSTREYARKFAMIVNFAERAHNHNWELDPVTGPYSTPISTNS